MRFTGRHSATIASAMLTTWGDGEGGAGGGRTQPHGGGGQSGFCREMLDIGMMES